MTDVDRLGAEQRARVLIDRQLADAGWVVQSRDQLNLFAGTGIAAREAVMAPGHGRVDYLLYVEQKAVGVIEAKPEGTPLSGVEWQSARYAEGLPAAVRLKALTVDFLKIDGMFIANLTDDPVNFEMVSAINRIGHVMGKRTVAECVEQTGVLEKLRELGVDYAQGFALGLPVPIDELLLRRSAPLRMHGG